jgi:medium-chain acyl-[acyl-carrier-protein] hydrolase
MRFKKELTTRSFYIDRFAKLSTSFMFYQMQDIAWEHAHTLGFGFDHLKVEQQFWVLSKLLVKITRMPVWGENFTLETWSRGTDGFFAYRDYNFVDKNDEIIIQATTSWLVLDLETKRIVRLSGIKGFPEYSESSMGKDAGKVKTPVSDETLVFSPVLFNEIDINQHFNTGRYLERIIDSYDFGFHEKYELTELEINFLKEGLPDDRFAVKKVKTDEINHLCSVVRESDQSDLVRARLVWKNR